jgi:putative RecB family exonuclease
MTCPLLFRYRTIDRLPQEPSSAAVRGTLVHAVLERLFDLPAADRTPQQAATLLAPEWARLQEAEPEVAGLFTDATEVASWLASAGQLLEGYFALEDPRRLDPAEREAYVEVVLPGGLRLRGIVDRLDVAPSGDLRVVDYKTGRAPGEAFEGKALFQMKFYALVLWRTRGVVPRRLQLMYLGDREVLSYAPDESDLLATERKLLALWEAIERAVQARDFRPRPSKLCEWCDHQAFCPEKGGTLLPWPEVVPDPDEPEARHVAAAARQA